MVPQFHWRLGSFITLLLAGDSMGLSEAGDLRNLHSHVWLLWCSSIQSLLLSVDNVGFFIYGGLKVAGQVTKWLTSKRKHPKCWRWKLGILRHYHRSYTMSLLPHFICQSPGKGMTRIRVKNKLHLLGEWQEDAAKEFAGKEMLFWHSLET